jgi:serine/threonine protein kinase
MGAGMEPLSAEDPRMIGEFRLHSRLGAGGMGQVYLGFSPAGRAVAIKVIHSQFARDPEFLRRFSHEVKAARAVGGMYTAPVVDSSVSDSSSWLATAYVPGLPLSAIVAKYGALPEAAVWRLAAGLAEALRAVHAAGVIHRDLKPANVLLADDGPHVIDFGISRPFQGTQLTSAGMVMGTLGYMSPEQAKGAPTDPASDIFSLGCVLAYATTGRSAFEGDNPASVLFLIVNAEPDLNAIPPRLRQVIEACLKKDPAQRPTPAQVVAMIGALGPETPTSLGSFWPGEVARVIAAERSGQTPAGLTPPEPVPYAGSAGNGAGSGAGKMPGSAGGPSSPPAMRTPTVQATPSPGQVGSPTGHAPMLSDGYYAAAAQARSAPATGAPGSSIPPPSSAPQPYTGSQPYTGQQLGGQTPSGQPSAGSTAYGQAVFGQPGLGTAAPYPGQAPSYPGQAPSYPGQQPGGVEALPGYAPGRRKPMTAEVPKKVHRAIRLMYIGFCVTALDVVLSLVTLRRYTNAATAAQDAANQYTVLGEFRRAAAQTAIMNYQNTMSGAMAIGFIADILGLVCWVWLAMATRRGRGWTRLAGPVLLGLYSICMLVVVFGTHNDPGTRFTTVVVWVLGIAAVVPLRSQQARDFFSAWRKR